MQHIPASYIGMRTLIISAVESKVSVESEQFAYLSVRSE
jgi:hypothetical protein